MALSRSPSPFGVTVVSIGLSPAKGRLPLPTRRPRSSGACRSIVRGDDATVRPSSTRRTTYRPSGIGSPSIRPSHVRWRCRGSPGLEIQPTCRPLAVLSSTPAGDRDASIPSGAIAGEKAVDPSCKEGVCAAGETASASATKNRLRTARRLAAASEPQTSRGRAFTAPRSSRSAVDAGGQGHRGVVAGERVARADDRRNRLGSGRTSGASPSPRGGRGAEDQATQTAYRLTLAADASERFSSVNCQAASPEGPDPIESTGLLAV